MTTINGMTPAEWVDSDKILRFSQETGDEARTVEFIDHQERDEETGELVPAWPPGAESASDAEFVAPNGGDK